MNMTCLFSVRSILVLLATSSTIACMAPAPEPRSEKEEAITSKNTKAATDKPTSSAATETGKKHSAAKTTLGEANPGPDGEACFFDCLFAEGGPLAEQAAQALDCEATCSETDTQCADGCWAAVDAACDTNPAACTSLDTALQSCETQCPAGADPGTGGTGTGTGSGTGWPDDGTGDGWGGGCDDGYEDGYGDGGWGDGGYGDGGGWGDDW